MTTPPPRYADKAERDDVRMGGQYTINLVPSLIIAADWLEEQLAIVTARLESELGATRYACKECPDSIHVEKSFLESLQSQLAGVTKERDDALAGRRADNEFHVKHKSEMSREMWRHKDVVDAAKEFSRAQMRLDMARPAFTPEQLGAVQTGHAKLIDALAALEKAEGEK